MIITPYTFPVIYFLRTFISSPIRANIDLIDDIKRDFKASKAISKKNIIWINGIPKSGTTLVSSILDFIGYVEGNRSLLRKFNPSGIEHPHDISEGFFKYFPQNKYTYIKTHTHHKAEFVDIANKYHTSTIITLRDIRPMMLSRYWHIMSDKNHWQHNLVKELNFEEGFKQSLISGYSYKKLSPIEYYQNWIIDWIKNKDDANLILWFEDYKSKPLEYIERINKCVQSNLNPNLIESHLEKFRTELKNKNLTLAEKLNLPGKKHSTIRNPNEDWKEIISDKLNQWILTKISKELTLKE